MNNETKHDIRIKLRYDNVFDLYVNGQWITSRGCYQNIADEVRKVLKTIDEIDK